jgi:hypothetical protein
MISFGILTSAPADLGNFLVAQGLLNADFTPAIDGLEWVRVPNLIVTSLGPPPVYDARIMFMVKFSGAGLDDQTAGLDQTDAQGNPLLIWQRTKLGAWILAHSAVATATDATGKTYRGRKVTGQPVWLIREDDAAQIGVWQ